MMAGIDTKEIQLQKQIQPEGIIQKFFFYNLRKMKNGTMYFVFPDNNYIRLGEDNGKEPAFLMVNDKRFFLRTVLYGDIGFAESYMFRYIDTPDLYRVLEWFLDNAEYAPTLQQSRKKGFLNLLQIYNYIIHKLRKNTEKNARKNISYHYDLSTEFYRQMLDETLTYSSGIFHGSAGLKDAQIAKYERICRKLNLKPGLRILEIGSGWGGFSRYAAENYGCYVDSITISKDQYEYVKTTIQENQLGDRIRVFYLDYRKLHPDIHGKYDRIVSIEMAEALGYEYFDEYFKTIERMLKDDGLAVIQYINYPENKYDDYIKTTDFIQKYIFPGGQLLSHYEVLRSLKKTGLCLYDLESFGLSYAETLKRWKENFLKNTETIKNLGFGETFLRMWFYYLNYCEVGFRERYVNVTQILLSRSRNKNLVDSIYF